MFRDDAYDEPYEYQYEDFDPFEYWSDDEDRTSAIDPVWVGIARIPLILLQETAAALKGCQASHRTGNMRQNLPRAWMRALAEKFPETSLSKVRSTYPCLLPHWLAQEFENCQVWTYA
jgi:hypothetical protein